MTKEEYVLQLTRMLKALGEMAEDDPGADPLAYMQSMFELTRELYQVTNGL